MPVLSYVHQLFSAEQCQAYVPMLRWKDRPLHCPRCQSCDVRPWGMYHDRPGLKRYWCHGCRRTFNDLTHTLLAQSQRSLAHWILATSLLCLSCSSHRIARELGVHVRTSYRWCWRLQCPLIVYTDVNGVICKIQQELPHQESRGERFIAQHEEPLIR